MWQWKTKICCHLLKNWELHIKTSHRLKGWVNLQMQVKTIFWLKAKDGIIWKHPAWIAEKIGHILGSQVLEKQPEGYTNVVATGARRQPRPPWQSSERDVEKGFPTSFLIFCPHRGHSPEWYNKGFGHLCAAEVAKIRNSFQPLIAEGPETKIWVFPSVTSNSGKRKRKQTRGRERAREEARERGRGWWRG